MFLRIAHRGAAGTRPELTQIAFERAMEIGVDMIELDVQLTRDRRLVVLHDLELGRTVSGVGAVRDCALDELQQLDAGSWFDPAYAGARVLSLDQVLELTRDRVELNVEIKSPAPDWQATAEVLIELLESHRGMSSVVVSSFSMQAIRAVRAVSSAARLAVLWHEPNVQDAYRNAEELGAEAIHPHYRLVNERLIANTRRRDLKVNTWTVNKPARMQALIALGVGGLISDFPERFPKS